MASAGIQVCTGRKWNAEKSLEVAESRLRQRALVGSVATRHAGFGYFPATRDNNTQGKEQQHLVQEEVWGRRRGSTSQQDGGDGTARSLD